MFLYYLRLAWKSARATPGLTLLTIGAIALGVAIPTTLLSARQVLGQDPIPEKSDRLFNVRVDNWDPASEFFDIKAGDPPKHITYRDMRGLMTSEVSRYRTGIAAARAFVFPESESIRPYPTTIRLCHADFFPMFAVPFRYGGGWNRKADEAQERVVVLSEASNQKLFGGRDSVGEKVRLGTEAFTVVGVLAHYHPVPQYYDVINNAMGEVREFFVPFDTIRDEGIGLSQTGDTDGWGEFPRDDYLAVLDSAEYNWIQYWVEVAPEKLADYRAFVDDYTRSQKELGRFPKPLNNRVTPLTEWMRVRDVVPPAVDGLIVLSVLFLVVCCLNLTGLLLGKFLAKSGVLGVHRALGAPRSAIFLQRLIECELLGLGGGVVGLGLAALCLQWLDKLAPGAPILSGMFAANGATFGIAFALALAAGLVSGLYPAWRACRVPPALQLKLQ
ncbi:MAG: ABC transporter permease [Acidobacteria bacterium]|nr:ABC transporter permease [Acidobacteriota bacterium]MCB9377342.1 ABC transporter permease [Holophagales bacterium]